MLRPVSPGQVRFVLPGLAPDSRGVAVGREIVSRFASLDRMVRFLRLLSGEGVDGSAGGDGASDDLWRGLKILHVRSSLGLREVIVLTPAPGGGASDAVARAARTAGGQCFTGSGRHHVQYRDGRAVLGYDVADAADVTRESGDLFLYTADGVAAYAREGETSFERLLFGLEPARQPGPPEAAIACGAGATLWVTARRGLGQPLVEYFFRHRIDARGALWRPERDSAFGPSSSLWIFRVDDPPPRLAGVLLRTPGIGLFAPVLDHVLVAAGYRHPIHIEACRAALAPDRLVLFAPPPAGVTVMDPPPRLVPVGDLVTVHVPIVRDAAGVAAMDRGGSGGAGARGASAEIAAAGRQRADGQEAAAPGALDMEIRLRRAPARPGPIVAALVPWSQAAGLRHACYALPAPVLRGCRVARLEAGILIIAEDRLDGFPFGLPLTEAAPRILIPVGSRLFPQVDPAMLPARLGVAEGGCLLFVAPGETPLRVAASLIEPLERHILGRLSVAAQVAAQVATPAARPRDPGHGDAAEGDDNAAAAGTGAVGTGAAAGPDAGPPDVIHDPLGPWPLWGLR